MPTLWKPTKFDEIPPEKAYRILESGPVVMVSTRSHAGEANLMTMGFHMMISHAPPLVGAVIGPWDHSQKALLETGECVLAVPTVDLAESVVDIGNCSGDQIDKFDHFGMTPLPAQTVGAPEMIHLSGHARLMALVPVIHEETRDARPARGMMLKRLLEILMIEALRSGLTSAAPPGLLRGLADPQLAAALSRIHSDMTSAISVTDLARVAAMSRSALFARFRAEIGATLADYITKWRMAVARDLLLQGALTNAEIAHRVGYSSASAFGMAFSCHEGVSPRGFVERGAQSQARAIQPLKVKAA